MVNKLFKINSSDFGSDKGLKNILNNYYESQLSEIDNKNDQLKIRKLIEEGLIIEGARVGLPKAAIIKDYNISEALLTKILKTRLIRIEHTHLGDVFELSHDTLINPVLKSFNSRLEKEKRRKELRKFIWITSIASFIAVIAITMYLFQQRKNKASELVTNALKERDKNPTIAFQKLKEAYSYYKTPATEQLLFNSYDRDAFYAKEIIFDTIPSLIASSPINNNFIVVTGNLIHFMNEEGLEVSKTTLESPIQAISYLPNDEKIVVGCQNHTLKLLSKNGDVIKTYPTLHKDWINAIAVSNDGQYILTGGRDNIAILWNVSGDTIKTFQGHDGEIFSVDIASDMRYVLTTSDDYTSRVWSIEQDSFWVLEGHTDKVFCGIFSSNQDYILTTGRDATIIHYELINGHIPKKPRILNAQQLRINHITETVQGNILASSDDNNIYLLNTNGAILKVFKGHKDWVFTSSINYDNSKFITCSEDKTIKIWPFNHRWEYHKTDNDESLTCLAVSPDGKDLLIGSSFYESNELADFDFGDFDFDDNSSDFETLNEMPLKIWASDGGKVNNTLLNHKDDITSCSYSKDGSLAISTSVDKTAILWRDDLQHAIELIGHKDAVEAAAISPNNKYISTVSSDSSAIVWDTQGKILKLIKHNSIVTETLFLDNELFLTADFDGFLNLWDCQGTSIKKSLNHNARIDALAYNHKQEKILTGDWKATIRIFNKDLDLLNTITINNRNRVGAQAIKSICVAPDGETFACSTDGNSVFIYSMKGKLLRYFDDFDNTPNDIQYSSSGNSLYVVDNGGYLTTIKLDL